MEAASQRLDMAAIRLPNALAQVVQTKRAIYLETAARLQPKILSERISNQRERVARAGQDLSRAVPRLISEAKERFASKARLLDGLGYQATLDRGYAVVRKGEEVITEAANAQGELEVEFKDGRVSVSTERQGRLL